MRFLKNIGRKVKNTAKKVGGKVAKGTKKAVKAVGKGAKKTGKVSKKVVGKVARKTPVINAAINTAKSAKDVLQGKSLKEVTSGAASGTRVGQTVTTVAKNAKNIGKVVNAARKGNVKGAVTHLRDNSVVKDRQKKLRQYRERTALLENLKKPSKPLNRKTRERDLKTIKEFIKTH